MPSFSLTSFFYSMNFFFLLTYTLMFTSLVKSTELSWDILDSKTSLLLLLFDSIDHKELISHLEEDYGITESVVEWMKSYLSGRCQIIDINGTKSDKIRLNYGFPQGSKIRPFGFLAVHKTPYINNKISQHPDSSVCRWYTVVLLL